MVYGRRVTTGTGEKCQTENTKKKKKTRKVGILVKGGSQKSIKSKTHVGINVIGSIYEGELKLLKEISSHSRGKPSIVSW